MFFVFLGVFLVRMSTIQGLGVLHVWLISSIFAVFIVVLTCFCEFDKFVNLNKKMKLIFRSIFFVLFLVSWLTPLLA